MYEARSFDSLTIEEGLRLTAAEPEFRLHRTARKPLYLYGRGNLGRVASDFFKTLDRAPDFTFDRKFTLDAALGSARGVYVIVAVITSPYAPIERSLAAQGFDDISPFYDFAHTFRGRHPLAENGWYADPFSDVEESRIAEVWHRWEDPISRAHHLQFIAWRRIREEWIFADAPVSNDDRYFIPEVRAALHDHEVFLDAGACHGEVSKRFVQVVGGAFDRIVTVEPDSRNVSAISFARQKAFHCALGSGRYVGYFRDGFGYASRLGDASNGRPCKVETIDGLTIPATFIKLHLEGGELDALRGAIHTLRTHRPVLAVTVYHSADGIWRTPEWLMANLPDYRFLFRNHCWCGAGAVVYAIPNERAR